MSRGIWTNGPPAWAERLLERLLPADDWSHEFVAELRSEFKARADASVTRARLWYLSRIAAVDTLQFIRLARRRAKRRHTSMGREGMMGGLGRDVVLAARSWTRDRRVALFSALTLALGLAGAATLIGVADRLFLAGPLHLQDSGTLARVYLTFDEEAGERTSAWLPWLTLRGVSENSPALEGLSTYRYASVVGRAGDGTTLLEVTEVDAGYFDLLGTTPELGRLFTRAELTGADPGSRDVAVISHSLWKGRFGGSPEALGSSIEVGERTVTVVGVARPGFSGATLRRVDLWVPLDPTTAGSTNWWGVVRLPTGRLGESEGLARVAAELDAIHQRTDPGRFFGWASDGRITLAPLGYDDEGSEPVEANVVRLLLGMVTLILLLACANVVNLLLARMTRRRKEFAVRVALGIGQWRLLRSIVIESLLLAGAAALLSLPLVHFGTLFLRRTLLPGVEWSGDPIGWTMALTLLGMAVVVGVGLGLLPARRVARSDVRDAMRASASGSGSRQGIHAFLASGQIALAAALLMGAALFVQSFWNLRSTELGYDATRVGVVTLAALDDASLPVGSQAEELAYREAMRISEEDPDIEGAALILGAPFLHGFSSTLVVPGLDSIPALPGGGPWLSAVTPGYFRVAGTRILTGRPIEAGDEDGAVIVVSQSMAELLWPNADPLGKCVRVGGAEADCRQVVGVAENVHRSGYREPPSMQYYLPYGTTTDFGGTAMVVRASRSVSTTLSRLDRTLPPLIPGVEFSESRTLAMIMEPEIRPWRMGGLILGMSALLAVAVAGLGVFGVLSYLVSQRRREIGVRIALGASRARIRVMALGIGMRSAAAGVIAGLALALAAGPWVNPLLHETKVLNPLLAAGVAATLVVVTLGACLLPARQAAAVEPISCLKEE